jgi:hypothetical protein
VTFVAADDAVREGFLRGVGSDLPKIDASDSEFATWLEGLKPKDVPELTGILRAAKALNSSAINLRKRANPVPLKDQREREPVKIPNLPDHLRLANPGALFPDQICDEIDAAQENVFSNNKPSGRLAEKSTQFAALAEAIEGGMLPELRGTDHRRKNEDNVRAYKGSRDEIVRLAKLSAKHGPDLQDAIRILGRELAQSASADEFVKACAERTKLADPWPAIPAWVSAEGRADLEARMQRRSRDPGHIVSGAS